MSFRYGHPNREMNTNYSQTTRRKIDKTSRTNLTFIIFIDCRISILIVKQKHVHSVGPMQKNHQNTTHMLHKNQRRNTPVTTASYMRLCEIVYCLGHGAHAQPKTQVHKRRYYWSGLLSSVENSLSTYSHIPSHYDAYLLSIYFSNDQIRPLETFRWFWFDHCGKQQCNNLKPDCSLLLRYL